MTEEATQKEKVPSEEASSTSLIEQKQNLDMVEAPQGEKVAVQHTEAGHVQETVQRFPLKFQNAQQLAEYVVKRRVYDDASWRALEDETGYPKSTLYVNFDAACKQAKAKLVAQAQQTPQTVYVQPNMAQLPLGLPHGDRAITQQQWEVLDKLDKKNIPSWKALVDQYNWEMKEKQEQIKQANPGGQVVMGANPQTLSSREALNYMQTQQIMQNIQLGMLQTQKIMSGLQNPQQPGEQKTFFDAAKWGFVEARKMGDGSKTSNVFDLKLEEMRQGHDLDMVKLQWQMKKDELQRQNEANKWDNIKETFAPVLQMASPEIKDIIKQTGQAVGRSLGGIAKPTHEGLKGEIHISCPKCNSPLKVDKQKIPQGESLINVKCNKCGHLFKVGERPVEEGSSSKKQSNLRPKAGLRPTYT